MNRKCLILNLFVVFLFISCEKIIPISQLTNTNKLTINAFVSPDTTLMLSVTRSYGISDQAIAIERNYDLRRWEYKMNINSYNFDEYGNASEELKAHTITDAIVSITVNDKETFNLAFDSTIYMYKSSYIPSNGDKIVLTAEGKTDSLTTGITQRVTSQIEIPLTPHFEIISSSINYKELTAENNGSVISFAPDIDSVLSLRLKLYDDPKSKNYYCLKIRTYSYYYESGGYWWDWHPTTGYFEEPIYIPPKGELIWHANDHYRSDDILFRDNRLHKGFIGWRAYFSNVFDDKLFKDGEYIVDIETALCYSIIHKRKVRIELQSISEDYFRYLQGYMIFRITEDDNFAEEIYIHSNVKNGYGIIAAANSRVISFDL